MKSPLNLLAAGIIAALLLVAPHVEAAIITFHADDAPGISGTVSFDGSVFDGSGFQHVSNADITSLDLTVFGEVFGLADVQVADNTVIDSAGAIPRIEGGAGLLAANGSGLQLAFFPDGTGGTPLDGDASLAFGTDVFGEPGVDVEFYAVKWNVVPEPGTMTIFAALGLAGLGLRRRKS